MTGQTTMPTVRAPSPVREWPALDLAGTGTDPVPEPRLAVSADEVVRRRRTMIRGPQTRPVTW